MKIEWNKTSPSVYKKFVIPVGKMSKEEAEKQIKELNPALYAFDAKWLWENLAKIKNENVQKEYLLTDLINIAFEQNKKIETVQIANIIEAFQPNSKEELENLEKIMV